MLSVCTALNRGAGLGGTVTKCAVVRLFLLVELFVVLKEWKHQGRLRKFDFDMQECWMCLP